jgi:hypothetical protein
MQLNSLLVLSVALLSGARHPTPTVVLVPQTDAIRTALPGAKQFFVRTSRSARTTSLESEGHRLLPRTPTSSSISANGRTARRRAWCSFPK